MELTPRFQRLIQRFFYRVQAGRQFDGLVRVAAGEAQLALVIFDFHLHELQPVRRRDDHHPLFLVDLPCLKQLD